MELRGKLTAETQSSAIAGCEGGKHGQALVSFDAQGRERVPENGIEKARGGRTDRISMEVGSDRKGLVEDRLLTSAATRRRLRQDASLAEEQNVVRGVGQGHFDLRPVIGVTSQHLTSDVVKVRTRISEAAQPAQADRIGPPTPDIAGPTVS